MFKEHKGSKAFNVNSSLAELIGFCATNNGGKQSEIAKGLRKDLKLHEEVYWQVCIYYFAKNKNWEDSCPTAGRIEPTTPVLQSMYLTTVLRSLPGDI